MHAIDVTCCSLQRALHLSEGVVACWFSPCEMGIFIRRYIHQAHVKYGIARHFRRRSYNVNHALATGGLFWASLPSINRRTHEGSLLHFQLAGLPTWTCRELQLDLFDRYGPYGRWPTTPRLTRWLISLPWAPKPFFFYKQRQNFAILCIAAPEQRVVHAKLTSIFGKRS